MKAAVVLSFALPFLAGCWALTDVSANRDLDRSLPYATEVKSGALSVRTPVVHLIQEKVKAGISLRSVDIGIIAPERYTAFRTNRPAFEAITERERITASVFRRYDVSINDEHTVVYLIRVNQRDTVKLVYMAYLGAADDGVAVANTEYFFDTAFTGNPWWDKPPEFFLRFAESVRLSKRPNQPPEPTALSVTIRACARLAPASTVAHL